MTSRSFPLWLALVFAMLCGAGIALQSRINGELGSRLGDGVTAAVISFGSGLLILIVAMAIAPAGRRGLVRVTTALRSRELPWWYVAGGAAGAFLVLSQGVAAAVLGVALFTVSVVAGQTVSGLVLDRVGLGPGGRRPITPARLAGAIIALAAVTWAVSSQFGGGVPVWLMLLPLIAGLGLGWQQAVNGQVRVVAESALTATFINFAVGTTVLLVLMAVDWSIRGLPHPRPPEPAAGGAVALRGRGDRLRLHRSRRLAGPRDRRAAAGPRDRRRSARHGPAPGRLRADFDAARRLLDDRGHTARTRRRRGRERQVGAPDGAGAARRAARRAGLAVQSRTLRKRSGSTVLRCPSLLSSGTPPT